ncbi:MAG: carbon-nitrogen hydrolase family protein, partial [Planctomycetota bacterium]|nr:carbon-nitrogen hydrolase family protein [Planctomycetota bacterium]
LVRSERSLLSDVSLLVEVICDVVDGEDGMRRNTALVIDERGSLLGTYSKCHLPEEEGFWETSHYGEGDEFTIFEQFAMPLGVQICSDNNRPEGCHILAALGAEVIVNPRATEAATYARWRHAFIANAWTSGAYVLSVNRPAPEGGVLLGGPSIAVAPNGEVIAEGTDPVMVVDVKRSAIETARAKYPGYLPVRADLYARAWTLIAERRDRRLDGYPWRYDDRLSPPGPSV